LPNAVGAVLGWLVTKHLAARIGAGWADAAGCLLYAAPLVLWPLAHGAMPLVLAMLFAAEFVSGFALLLPTPLPRYRLPAMDGPARA
jgi:hypothetical protein